MKIDHVRVDEKRVAQLMVFFSGVLKSQQGSLPPGSGAIRSMIVEQIIALQAVSEDTLRHLPPEVEGPVRDEVKKILDAISSGLIESPTLAKPAPALVIVPGRN